MRRKSVTVGLVLVFAFLLVLPALSQAVELTQGMTQGDFALWLVKAIGAESKLPPAYGAEDAVNLLTQLGSIPEGGWQKNEEMTAGALAGLLENADEAGNLSWDELVEKVREHIQKIFDNRQLGVFRVLSATPVNAEVA